MSSILKFSSLKISLETFEHFFSREEKIEISREASWDIWNSPLSVKVSSRCLLAIYGGCNIFFIISKRLERNGPEYCSVTCAFLARPTPDSCVLSWNESFMNFIVENDHQISAFKSIFLKHFNKQILHGTLTSLSKKHSSAYRVEDKRKVLLSHHLGLTEEMLPLMRIIYRLSLREGIISVAWTDYGEVKHWIT